MNQISSAQCYRSKKKFFDSKKESILITYSHRFLRNDDPGWILLKEKLMYMKKIYGGRKSFQLCGRCMSISRTECSSVHLGVVVASIFFHINPETIKPTELADFFLKNGRKMIDKKGIKKICFPSFNLVCSEDYPFLSGSELGNICLRIQDLVLILGLVNMRSSN